MVLSRKLRLRFESGESELHPGWKLQLVTGKGGIRLAVHWHSLAHPTTRRHGVLALLGGQLPSADSLTGRLGLTGRDQQIYLPVWLSRREDTHTINPDFLHELKRGTCSAGMPVALWPCVSETW